MAHVSFAHLSYVILVPCREVARKRVAAAGLESIVELVLADFTDLSPNGRKALPEAGSVDIVTFSYSLSMIPDKSAALRQAASLLKPQGVLALADFFARGETSYQVGASIFWFYVLNCSRIC